MQAASLDAGLSGPSRLHDLFLTFEAMTPGEFEARDFEIAYGVHATPRGKAVFAVTRRGLGGLEFIERDATSRREAMRAALFVGTRGLLSR